jgi:co-chaperonin GroES (HSP10)
MNAFPFKPLSNYIVIEVVQKSKGNIVIPETVKKQLTADEADCIVVAVSEEKEKDGTPMVRNVKVGDSVILDNMVMHTGQAIMIQKKEYVIVRETSLIGIQITNEVVN